MDERIRSRIKDPFVTRLPLSLNRSVRIRIEIIAAAIDIIQCDVDDIDLLRTRFATRGPHLDVNRSERARLFRAAWSIVDRVHTISTLLQGQNDLVLYSNHPFFAIASVATKMRNAMAHIASQLKNLEKKGASGALIGTILYKRVNPDDVVDANGVLYICAHELVVINGSPLNHDWKLNLSREMGEVHYPIGPPYLLAFDGRLDLYEVNVAVQNIGEFINSDGEAQWRKQSEEVQQETGASVHDLQDAAPPAGAVIVRHTLDEPIAVSIDDRAVSR